MSNGSLDIPVQGQSVQPENDMRSWIRQEGDIFGVGTGLGPTNETARDDVAGSGAFPTDGAAGQGPTICERAGA